MVSNGFMVKREKDIATPLSSYCLFTLSLVVINQLIVFKHASSADLMMVLFTFIYMAELS